MTAPDILAAFRELNEAAHKAAKLTRKAGHSQAEPLAAVRHYTDQLVDGAAPTVEIKQ